MQESSTGKDQTAQLLEADLLRQEELVIWLRLLIAFPVVVLLFIFPGNFNFWPTLGTIIGAILYSLVQLLFLKRIPVRLTAIVSLALDLLAITVFLYVNSGGGSFWLLYLTVTAVSVLRFSIVGVMLVFFVSMFGYLLVILSIDVARPFTEEVVVRLLISLSISLAVGLVGRELQSQRRRYQALATTYRQGSIDWERAAQEAELRAEVARVVGYSPDLPHVFDKVTTEIKKLVDFDYASLNLADEGRRVIYIDALSTRQPKDERTQREMPFEGTGTAWVMANKKTHIATNLAEKRWFPSDEGHLQEGLLSAIRVPLIFQDRVLGTLTLLSRRPLAFGENERLILEPLAVQIATLVQNARLLEETKRRAEEASTMVEISRIISSNLELPRLIESLGDQIKRLIELDGGSIGLLEETGKLRFLGFVHEAAEALKPLTRGIPIDGTRSGWVIAHKKSMVISDMLQEPYLKHDEMLINIGRRSCICHPLIAKNRVIGVLWLTSNQPNHYNQHGLELVERIAAQVAVAIENADLLRETRELAEQEAALAEIGRILGSALSIDAVWDSLATQIRKIIDFDNINIALNEEDEEKWRFMGLLQGEKVTYEAQRLYPLDGSRFGSVIRSGEICLIEDFLENDFLPTEKTLVEGGLRSAVIVPLQLHGKTIGAIGLGSWQPGHYNQRHVALLQRIGVILASAVENYRLFEETQRLAITDGLTGLFNHRYLHEELEREVMRAKRLDYPIGLLFMDLDFFKEFNDTFGHQEGDNALLKVANAIKASLRTTDTIARYGGEEFVVILPDVGEEGLLAVGEKIRRAVATTILIEGATHSRSRLTVSIGGVFYPPDQANVNLLLKKADEALYEAKRLGRDRVYVAKTTPQLI